jgi:chromosomal replication initiator protein
MMSNSPVNLELRMFFPHLNYLHQNGKQVILTSDKAPCWHARYRATTIISFQMGTVSRIAPTWLRNKNFYLENILYRDGVEIPEEIIEYVARNIKSNVRELEGAIISWLLSLLSKKRSNIELAKALLKIC